MMVYRIYADGHEFGIDYPTLADAKDVKRTYSLYFPSIRYYIRKVGI